MSNKPIEEIFRKAEDAARRLPTLRKIEVVSDPDGGLKEALQIMESAFKQTIAFRVDEERTAYELGEVFRPGTELGDLLLLALPGTPEDQREEAQSRFMRGRSPIHEGRQSGYPEIKMRLVAMESEEKRAMYATALFVAAQVLGGWEDREPARKEVELGGGFKVTVRELSPLEVADVLQGDPATLGDLLLHLGFVGAGAYMPMTKVEKDAFFADERFNKQELELLLGEIRGFILDTLHQRVEVVRKALADLANEVTEDLLGPDWRRKEEPADSSEEGVVDPFGYGVGTKHRKAAISLGLELAGAVLEEEIGTFLPAEEAPFVKELFAEDAVRRILEEAGLTESEKDLFRALCVDGDTPTEIADRTGKRPGTVRVEIYRLRKKIQPFYES